jgi:hypothetical protein
VLQASKVCLHRSYRSSELSSELVAMQVVVASVCASSHDQQVAGPVVKRV